MMGLTRKQWRLLTYLREYIGQNGEAPTAREIQAALGISSTSGVWHRLTQLEERGYICRTYARTRAIALNDPPIIINGHPYRFIPITIAATGKSTAGTVKRTHWRLRPENAHRRHLQYPPAAPRIRQGKTTKEAREARDAMPRVDRDPCTYCGVRGDIGCAHQPCRGLSAAS